MNVGKALSLGKIMSPLMNMALCLLKWKIMD